MPTFLTSIIRSLSFFTKCKSVWSVFKWPFSQPFFFPFYFSQSPRNPPSLSITLLWTIYTRKVIFHSIYNTIFYPTFQYFKPRCILIMIIVLHGLFCFYLIVAFFMIEKIKRRELNLSLWLIIAFHLGNGIYPWSRHDQIYSTESLITRLYIAAPRFKGK